MAKILNNLTITSPVSKLVELPNNYVINAQFYNKTDISPIPLTFGIYPSSTRCEMATYKNSTHTGQLPVKVTNGVVPDSKDSSITYTVKPGSYNHTDGYAYSYLYKTQKDNFNNVTITSTKFNSDNGSEYSSIDIVDQDDTYVYVRFIGDGYKSYITRVEKESFTQSGLYDLGADKYVTLIKATEMYIYFAVTGLNNYFTVVKYNKIAGTGTIIKDDAGTTGGYTNHCIIAKDPTNDSIFYAVRDGFMLDSLHRVVIKKYVLDINTDIVDSSYVSLDLTGLTWGASIPMADNKNTIMNELFIFTDKDKKYLVYSRYGKAITVQNSSTFVFEIKTEDEFVLKQEMNYTPIGFTMQLLANNNKTLILANSGQLRFYTWNSHSTQFEHTSSIVRPLSCIGCDIDGNILVQYDDTSVDIYSTVMAINVTAVLEKENYEFEGNAVATNAIVYTQNFSAEFVSSNVKLTLIGPAVFTATGENKMDLTTSSVGPNILPITITDSGYVRIAIELI